MVSLNLQDAVPPSRSATVPFTADIAEPRRDPDWSPASWQQRVALQQPRYADRQAMEQALEELARQPALVMAEEVVQLKQALARAQEGKLFLLQGGDCAERFEDCTGAAIHTRLEHMEQMGLLLTHGLRRPIIRVGRLAGQYAKPRSADSECIDGVELPVYRGDIVNGHRFEASAREPDPQRMLQAHARSALTLNLARALMRKGFADLYQPSRWAFDWLRQSPRADAQERLLGSLREALQLLEALRQEGGGSEPSAHLHISHEALLLPYEQALTHYVPSHHGWFNLSTHFPWIGVRTADLEGAHVEYLRGIENPIAVKVGPATGRDQLLRLIERLNPDDEPGRLTLITRMGAQAIGNALPALIDAVRREGRRVLWVCDPMHGNTCSLGNGYKTRYFEHILAELEQAAELHAAHGSHLGGVHLEMSGEAVTECLGGAGNLTEADLPRNYRSSVDPRLNREQSLELALRLAQKFA